MSLFVTLGSRVSGPLDEQCVPYHTPCRADRSEGSEILFFKNHVFSKISFFKIPFWGNAVFHRRPPDRAVIFCYAMLHSESFPKSHFWDFVTFGPGPWAWTMGPGIPRAWAHAPGPSFPGPYLPGPSFPFLKSMGFLWRMPAGAFFSATNDTSFF